MKITLTVNIINSTLCHFLSVTFPIFLSQAVSVVAVKEMLDGSDRMPGEYGFDPLSFSNGKSDKVKKDFQAKEIENGR